MSSRRPYLFDRGRLGRSTGVECRTSSRGEALYRVRTAAAGSGRTTVTGTHVGVSRDGTRAVEGLTVRLGTRIRSDSVAARRATDSTCDSMPVVTF